MQAQTAIIRRVLVVCSDTTCSRVIEGAIRAWLFETIVCSSLREAEELLAKREFAVVFCGDRLNDGTYLDLLSLVGRLYKVPVVVMISDVDNDSVFREAMALGALGVVPTPCSAKDVQWMVIRAAQRKTSAKFTMNAEASSAAGSNGLSRK